MKKYLSYKEAIEKLTSNLPPKWNTYRAKGIFNQVDVRSQTGNEQLLSVSEHRGVVPRNEMKITMFMAESYEGYKLCEAEDLVINRLWAWGRGIGVSEYIGIVSTAYGVFRPKNKNQFNPKYLNYLLRTKDYVALYYMRSKGIWISRLQLQDKNFLDLPIICPPKEEQDEIVQYIKAQEEKINLFIQKKQRFIEMLKEQRQSVIDELVTNGVRKNILKKSSEIDWVKELPNDWSWLPLRWSCKIFSGGTPSTDNIEYWNSPDIPWLNSGEVNKSTILFADNYISHKGLSESSAKLVKPFSVVIALAGQGKTKGTVATLEIEAACNQSLAAIEIINENLYYKYLYYYLNSKYKQIRGLVGDDQRDGLNLQYIKSIKVPLPPFEEQKKIVSHIKTETATIDTAIAKAEREIELIREYKDAMIAEAVMGKRK